MRTIFYIFIMSLVVFNACAQSPPDRILIEGAEGSLRVIGKVRDNYLLVNVRIPEVYKLEFDRNRARAITYLKKEDFKEDFPPLYIDEDVEIYSGGFNKLIMYYDNNRFEIEVSVKYMGDNLGRPYFARHKNYLFAALSGYNSIEEGFKGDNLRYINLNNIQNEMKDLPFTADNVQASGDYIYFSSPIVSEEDGTIGVFDIYRFKAFDWSTPELVLKGNYTRGWFVYPQHEHLLYCTIFKDGFDNAIINISESAYASISAEERNTFKKLFIPLYIKSENRIYFLDIGRDDRNVLRSFLVLFPDIPSTFDFELND